MTALGIMPSTAAEMRIDWAVRDTAKQLVGAGRKRICRSQVDARLFQANTCTHTEYLRNMLFIFSEAYKPATQQGWRCNSLA